MKLPGFDGGAAEKNCGATWAYELDVTNQSKKVADPADYFTFDTSKLVLTLKAGGKMPENTISLLLLGKLASESNEEVKEAEKSISFKLVFAKETPQDLGPVPRAFIKSISSRGLILVHFDMDMSIPKRNTSAETETTSDQAARNLAGSEKNNVQGTLKQNDLYDLDLQEAFEVILLPDDPEFADMMRFEVELHHFETRELAIKLKFEHASFISQSTEADTIVVRLKDPSQFVSKKG